ncbi:MAG TPA: heme A synthase [Thermomicrobiales bacterium]|nr:heme A synthase [Thermomicrobiales bacterium]
MSTPAASPNQPSERLETWVKRLSFAAMIGMFLVLMMGSTVTNTGSAEGCGRHWPLCQGEFIPSYAVTTAIEFSHRVVTAVEGVLILAVSIGAILIRRGNRQVKVLVAVLIGTLILQSGMGAAAVMWPQSPVIMASHFGISMTCFAAIFLLTRYLYEPSSLDGDRSVKKAPPPLWFRRGVWASLVLSVFVAYVGAYMRHSGNELGCSTWPLCNGQVFPGFTGSEGISFSHRLLAGSLMLLIFGLAFWARSFKTDYPELASVLSVASVAIVGQALAGAFVVNTRLDLWTTLLHAALMAILFVMICDACRMVWSARPKRAAPMQESRRPSVVPAGD